MFYLLKMTQCLGIVESRTTFTFCVAAVEALVHYLTNRICSMCSVNLTGNMSLLQSIYKLLKVNIAFSLYVYSKVIWPNSVGPQVEYK